MKSLVPTVKHHETTVIRAVVDAHLDSEQAPVNLKTQVCLALIMATVLGNMGLLIVGLPWPVILLVVLALFAGKTRVMTSALTLLMQPAILGVMIVVVVRAIAADSLGLIAHLFSIATFPVAVAIVVCGKKHLLIRVVWLFLILLILSSIIFLLRSYEIIDSDELHAQLWQLDSIARSLPTGLAGYLHLFGYQLAMLVPLGFALTLGRESKQRFIGLIAVVLGVWALELSAQRSALLGTFIACIIIVVAKRELLKLLFLGVAALVIVNLVSLPNLGLSRLGDKFSIENPQNPLSISWRFQLQYETLGEILRHPFGLSIQGNSWEDVSRNFAVFQNGLQVAPHNAYFTVILNLGWWTIPWIIVVLVGSLVVFWSDLRSAPRNNNRWLLHLGLFCGFLSTAINSAFHNASLFTPEGTTWIAFCLLWLWHVIDRQQRFPTTMKAV